MRSKEDLFQLINAMTKSEKRYFSIDAQKSSKKGNKYFDLFKAINAMEEYDENKLKKKFPKNLATDKAYLYDAILRSMRDYNSAKSVSAQIKELIIDAKYLKERGLYRQSEQRLKDAKELAIQIDDRLALLEINREERDISFIIKKDFDQKIKELVKEKDISLQAIADFFKFSDVNSELSISLKKNFYPGYTEFDREIFSDDIPVDQFDHTPRTKRKYLTALAVYYRVKGDLKKSLEFFKKVVDFWVDFPIIKEENYFWFIADVSNLLSLYSFVGNLDHFPRLLELLEKQKISNEHLQGYAFQKISIYKTMYLLNTGAEHDINQISSDIDAGLSKYKINNASKLAVMLNTTMLVFVNEQYEGCYEWCNRIIKNSKNLNREDVLDVIYLIRLLSASEILDIEDFEKELRNTDRYFQSKEQPTKVEGIKKTIDLFKEAIFAPLLEQKNKYKEIVHFLNDKQSDQTNYLPSGIDELIVKWIQAKLDKRPLLKIISEFKDKNLQQIAS